VKELELLERLNSESLHVEFQCYSITTTMQLNRMRSGVSFAFNVDCHCYTVQNTFSFRTSAVNRVYFRFKLFDLDVLVCDGLFQMYKHGTTVYVRGNLCTPQFKSLG